MDKLDKYKIEIIRRCKKSPQFFIKEFCKVEHPLAGVLDFNLFTYQDAILNDFRKYRFNIFKKTRQCFIGSSMVMTPRGPVAIKDIEQKDEVYVLNRQTGAVEISTVDGKHKNGISDDLVEVRTKTGHISVCTKDHLFLTNRGWIEAGKLTENDVIVEVFEPQKYGISPNPSDPILLGYMLTDGSCGENNAYFANSRWKYLLEFKKEAKRRLGITLGLKKVKSGFENDSGKNYRVSSSHRVFFDWLKEYDLYGRHKNNKKIPKVVFSWNNESIALLLNRMFAADGWYSGSDVNEAGIGQQSIYVLYQIKQLLSRFGINCKIYEATSTTIPKLRIIGGNDFKLFVEKIGIYGKSARAPITKGFIFNRVKGAVKSVKPVEEQQEVYDLSIAPHHNYIVDGAVVHNCGISTLTGAYALWYAMFHTHKKVLIVSKRDLDAKEFLRKNVKFVFENLPEWLKTMFFDQGTCELNEHKIGFKSGSTITSLTSSPETLRSNSASVVIIDEAAFINANVMDRMWSAGWPTLQHGGSVIVISTTNGVGNWYWANWTDAELGTNVFHPIRVEWWDMDWEIPITDDDGELVNLIAPTKGMRKCETAEEIEKYGPYWSPWLEEQYRSLQQKGDDSKFRQEVLAQFVGTGQTVISGAVLRYIDEQLMKNKDKEGYEYKIPSDIVTFADNMTGENFSLDFNNELWIFDEAREGHAYSVGLDLSGGENKDFTAIVVWDITMRKQVAELNIKVLPKIASRMAVWISQYYNNAMLVVDRTGLGISVAQELEHELQYHNLWRWKKKPKEKGKVGLPINPSTKPTLNRVLRDNLGIDGWEVVSPRLYKQLLIYINLGNGRTGNESGPGNRDDIVMAAALGLLGVVDPISPNNTNMMLPMRSDNLNLVAPSSRDLAEKFETSLLPMASSHFDESRKARSETAMAELSKFSAQIIGLHREPGESIDEYNIRKKKELRDAIPATKKSSIELKSSGKHDYKLVEFHHGQIKREPKKRKLYSTVTVKRKHKL